MLVRDRQDNAVFFVKTSHQTFRFDGPDLLGWKIDHSYYLLAEQIGMLVMLCDLRAGFEQTEFVAEIDPQLVGRDVSLEIGRAACRERVLRLG